MTQSLVDYNKAHLYVNHRVSNQTDFNKGDKRKQETGIFSKTVLVCRSSPKMRFALFSYLFYRAWEN